MKTSSRLAILGSVIVVVAVGVWAYTRPVVDTERELVPDAVGRTSFRMNNLRAAIARHVELNHRLPHSLEDVLPSGVALDPLDDPRNDAWGRPIVLELVEAGYSLRSAGPDGVLGSEDDLTIRALGADTAR